MSDQWDDDDGKPGALVNDEEDIPDAWDADPPEQSKSSTNKSDKKGSEKIIKQPQGDFTPEELDKMEEKNEIEQEKAIEEQVEDLVGSSTRPGSLDNIFLTNRDQFLDYSERLSNHLQLVAEKEFYPDFIDHFLEGITKSMSVEQVKRLHATIQSTAIRKKSEEQDAKKKNKAKKTDKPQLKDDTRAQPVARAFDDDDYDYDDDDYN